MSDSVVDVVKTESAKQTVELVFAVVGVIILAVVTRHVTNPDQWRTVKMRSFLWLSDFAQKQEENSQHLRDWATTKYMELREW